MSTKVPELQRRHFELIAAALRSACVELPHKQRKLVAERFALRLSGSNERFDLERFVQAALTGGES